MTVLLQNRSMLLLKLFKTEFLFQESLLLFLQFHFRLFQQILQFRGFRSGQKEFLFKLGSFRLLFSRLLFPESRNIEDILPMSFSVSVSLTIHTTACSSLL